LSLILYEYYKEVSDGELALMHCLLFDIKFYKLTGIILQMVTNGGSKNICSINRWWKIICIAVYFPWHIRLSSHD